MLFTLLLSAACAVETNPKVGFYQWAAAPKIHHEASNVLGLAAKRIVDARGGLIRFYLGARYDYTKPVLEPKRFETLSDRTPASLVALEPYHKILSDPCFGTVVITVYPSRDYGGGPDDINLYRPWNAADEQAEYTQMHALTVHLYQRYGSLAKTIILANTEADSRLLEIANHTGSLEMAVNNVLQWQATRYRAVDDARRIHAGKPLRVLNAFEISLVNLKIMRQGSRFVKHAKGTANALYDIVPHVPFDLISYSCYESINAPLATIEPRLVRDCRIIRKVTTKPLMIGELGLARDQFDQIDERLRSAVKALKQVHPRYIVFWQAFDAPAVTSEPTQFGLLQPGRELPPSLIDLLRAFR